MATNRAGTDQKRELLLRGKYARKDLREAQKTLLEAGQLAAELQAEIATVETQLRRAR